MYNLRHNLILGFHGCDQEVADKLVNFPNKVIKSEKPYDWLGHGMYFWENNFLRAELWAKEKENRGEIKKAAVIGAVLTLDNCFDLLDSSSINLLGKYYELLKMELESNGKTLPKNLDIEKDPHRDKLKRELDCAVIEYMHTEIDVEIAKNIKEKGFSELQKFDSARGFFTEGGAAFPGSEIQMKSHSQICIRNMNCIKGFFKPRIIR
ncbi:MAG: hypothetical protein RL264_2168 [Bacteroidota bacterium]|jgi:hypothetical protein